MHSNSNTVTSTAHSRVVSQHSTDSPPITHTSTQCHRIGAALHVRSPTNSLSTHSHTHLPLGSITGALARGQDSNLRAQNVPWMVTEQQPVQVLASGEGAVLACQTRAHLRSSLSLESRQSLTGMQGWMSVVRSAVLSSQCD